MQIVAPVPSWILSVNIRKSRLLQVLEAFADVVGGIHTVWSLSWWCSELQSIPHGVYVLEMSLLYCTCSGVCQGHSTVNAELITSLVIVRGKRVSDHDDPGHHLIVLSTVNNSQTRVYDVYVSCYFSQFPRQGTVQHLKSRTDTAQVSKMGQAASVSKDAIVQAAKTKVNYLPPLGPPNQVSDPYRMQDRMSSFGFPAC